MSWIVGAAVGLEVVRVLKKLFQLPMFLPVDCWLYSLHFLHLQLNQIVLPYGIVLYETFQATVEREKVTVFID